MRDVHGADSARKRLARLNWLIPRLTKAALFDSLRQHKDGSLRPAETPERQHALAELMRLSAERQEIEDGLLRAADWPPVESIEGLAALGDMSGMTITERDRATRADIVERALNVSTGRQIEELQRARFRAEAERSVRAEEGRAAAIQATPQAAIQATPQAMTSDAKQAAAGDTMASDGVDIIATSPSGRVQLLKPCYAIVDGGKVKLIETQFVALLHVLNELKRGYRPAMDELAPIENECGSCQDGYRILKRLAKKEPWKSVIDLPGEPGRGIGIH